MSKRQIVLALVAAAALLGVVCLQVRKDVSFDLATCKKVDEWRALGLRWERERETPASEFLRAHPGCAPAFAPDSSTGGRLICAGVVYSCFGKGFVHYEHGAAVNLFLQICKLLPLTPADAQTEFFAKAAQALAANDRAALDELAQTLAERLPSPTTGERPGPAAASD